MAEGVAKGVVNNHLANNAPNLQQQQIHPPAPKTSTHIDTTERYIPPVQESLSQQLHPVFDAARLEESGILNTHRSHDQEENQ